MFYDYCQNQEHPFHRLRHFAAMGRRRGAGPILGGLMGAFGGEFSFGAGPFRFGRKFASTDLQLLILALLAERPRHGYELIKAFEELSGGFYTPSPGMIYPALSYLEEIGHATAETEGTKKFYHITDTGRAHLEQHRAAIDKTFEQLRMMGERINRFRSAFSETGDEDDDFRHGAGSREIKAARRAVKAALHQKRGCSLEEAKRIAHVLHRAAAEIERSS